MSVSFKGAFGIRGSALGVKKFVISVDHNLFGVRFTTYE